MSGDSKFARFHHLNLDNCTLRLDEAPVLDFMQSKRKIGTLIIGEVRYSGELRPFWELLAKTVTRLEIREFSPYTMRSYFLADIVAQFTRLEHLQIGTYHMNRQMLRTSNSTYTSKWPSVRHLVIDSLKLEPENYDFFAETMPNLQSLSVGMYEGSDDEFFRKYLSKLRRLGVSSKHYGVGMLVRLANLPECDLHELSCIAETAASLELVASVIDSQPNIRSVELSVVSFPRIAIQNLKILRLEFNEPVTSFVPLVRFPHLEQLEIKLSNYESKCFFGHEVVPIESLRKFSIFSFASGHCTTCHKFMFQSFANLRSFTYESCFVTSVETLALISKHLKGIEHLTLKYFVTQSLKLDGFLQEWTKMPRLKQLEIRAFGNVSKDGLSNLAKKCPAMEFLAISNATNVTQKLLDVLFTKMKKLRCVKIEQKRQPHEVLRKNLSYTVEDDASGRRIHCYKL